MLKNKAFLASKLSDVVFLFYHILINVKMPTIGGKLTFISLMYFMLSRDGHEKSFISSEPGFWHFVGYPIFATWGRFVLN